MLNKSSNLNKPLNSVITYTLYYVALIIMKLKLYFEDRNGTMGGWEYVGLLKLMWWILIGRIRPKENSAIYFIRKIETKNGMRI